MCTIQSRETESGAQFKGFRAFITGRHQALPEPIFGGIVVRVQPQKEVPFGAQKFRELILRAGPPERRELMKIAHSRSVRSEDGRRARIILDLGRGRSLRAISGSERCSVNTVRLWRERFREGRLAGLYSRHRGRQPTPGREKLETRIIDWRIGRHLLLPV